MNTDNQWINCVSCFRNMSNIFFVYANTLVLIVIYKGNCEGDCE